MSGPARGANCSVCDSPRLRHIDQLVVRGGRSITGIAHENGVGKDALFRHIKNQHIGTPAPTLTGPLSASSARSERAYEYSEDEQAAYDTALDQWALDLEDQTGIDVLPCYAHTLPPGHPDDCPACVLAEKRSGELAALTRYQETKINAKPGRWLPR